MTRRMSAILGEYSPAGQGCTRHFSVPPLEYKNSTSYKKYRPEFGLNIQESYKRPIHSSLEHASWVESCMAPRCGFGILLYRGSGYASSAVRPL